MSSRVAEYKKEWRKTEKAKAYDRAYYLKRKERKYDDENKPT